MDRASVNSGLVVAALADRTLRTEVVVAQTTRSMIRELRPPTGGRNFLGKSMEITNRVRVATECIYKFSVNFGSLLGSISDCIAAARATQHKRLRFRLRFYFVEGLVYC